MTSQSRLGGGQEGDFSPLHTAADHSYWPPPQLFLGHRGIDYQPYLGKAFFSFFPPRLSVPPNPPFFLKNKLEAIPMINYQLPNALPLAISGRGMNYLEKHPKREPTVKENQKGYLGSSS